jgi:toxin ParE1/3/4
MACQIIWSPVSLGDLHDLVHTIAADSSERAENFAYRLMQQLDKLHDFPEIGRQVPEQHNPNIREIIVAPYRVIYRFREREKVIEVVRVWHSARGEPKLKAH